MHVNRFITDIFGDALSAGRRLAVFTVPGLQTRLFADAAEAAAYARERSPERDVYYGVGLIRGSPSGRGKARDVAAIGALWADIDLLGPGRESKPLPATVDETRRILQHLPHPPSLLVHSGHGLHAYWVLKEPWTFDTDAERNQAARLAKGWHGTVCAAAESLGWHMENLGDLTRVLRLPGTLNHKGDPPAEVRVLESHPDRRYNPDDFEAYLVETAGKAPPSTDENLVLRAGAEPPAAKMAEAVATCPKFRWTWNHERPDLADQSQSGYDLALASIAARLDWTDQETADLLIAARRHHKANPKKALRPDYIRCTLGLARSGAEAVGREGPDVDLSALAPARAADEPPPENTDIPDPEPLPERLLHMPGFVAEVMAYTLATARYGQPVMAFAAALILQAFLAGRKIRDASDVRTNLYLLALANSGVGKDHPRRVNQRILVEAGRSECFGDHFASGEGIEDRMFTIPSMLFQTDEINALVLAIAKGNDPRWEGIMSVLLRFFTSASAIYPTRVKAGQSPGIIDQPSLCLLGTAIPKHYYESMSPKMLTNGFFARMLVLETGSRVRGGGDARRPLPERLVQTATWWSEYQPGRSGGNLQAWHPEPAWIEATPEAEEALEALRDKADEEYASAEETDDLAAMAVWARAYEKARKLALIYAASENPQAPKVTLPGARWADEFVLVLTRQMLARASRHVAESEFQAKCNRLIDVLARWRQTKGEEWMPFWRLSRKLPWSDREHEEVRTALRNMKRIEYAEKPTGGTPKRLYKLR